MSPRRIAALAAVSGALALPAAADAHVSLHPNVVPAGAFTELSLRVPNESDTAMTTRVAVQMPPGFLDVTASPPAGWRFSTKTRKLAKPVKTGDGTLTSEVAEIDFTGGKLPPGQFAEFPIAVVVPGKAGDVLTFKTVQTYSDGKVSRWIGPPDADQPAPTIDVSAKGGVIEDVAGGEAGPPAGVTGTAATGQRSAPAATRIVEKSTGASKPLALAALILAAIGTLIGIAALVRPASARVRR